MHKGGAPGNLAAEYIGFKKRRERINVIEILHFSKITY